MNVHVLDSLVVEEPPTPSNVVSSIHPDDLFHSIVYERHSFDEPGSGSTLFGQIDMYTNRGGDGFGSGGEMLNNNVVRSNESLNGVNVGSGNGMNTTNGNRYSNLFGRGALMNPHIALVMRNHLRLVNPNLVCIDPFYDPKRNVNSYTNVFRRKEMVIEERKEEIGGREEMIGERNREVDSQLSLSRMEREKEEDVNVEKVEIKNEMETKTEQSEESKKSLKRKLEEMEGIPDGFKLPVSKSPIMEAMAYCAVKKWGVEVEECRMENSTVCVKFKVTDFEKYCKFSTEICSKQNPTDDIGSRVKSLRRWFTNFPKKKDRKDNSPFSLEVKPDLSKKVHDMVEKYGLMTVKKRNRIK